MARYAAVMRSKRAEAPSGSADRGTRGPRGRVSAPRAMVRSATSLVVGLGLLFGCGGGSMRAGPLNPGQVDTDPSIECLPDPDVQDAQLTRRYRFGLTLATESFLVPPPAPPDDRGASSLTRWSEDVLASWLERKQRTIEAAREELDAAAEQNHRQRIMGGAIVGLMYEDVARVLRAIPPPSELDSEPEIQAIYQDVLRGQARPFLEHARRAYRACAQNAIRPDSMRHWSRFCRRRGDRLPEREGIDTTGPANGETTVEVIVD